MDASLLSFAEVHSLENQIPLSFRFKVTCDLTFSHKIHNKIVRCDCNVRKCEDKEGILLQGTI